MPHRVRSRLPIGFLGMLAILGLGERYIRRHDDAFLGYLAWDWRTARQAADDPATEPLILGFGDSLLKLSTMPEVLEAKTGLSTYNLAVSGGQAPSSYYLLRAALEAGARPRLILLETAPTLLRLPPDHNLGNWPQLLSVAEAAELARIDHDSDHFTRAVLTRLMAAYSCREGLDNAIRLGLAGAENRHWIDVLTARVAWRRQKGAQVASPKAGGIEGSIDVEPWRAGFYPSWEVHPTNAEYLRRFLDLAESHKIPVLWVVPPLLPALQAANDASGFSASQDAFLNAILARYPGTRVIDGRALLFPPDAFLDPNHLNHRGAVEFSAVLAEAIVAPSNEQTAWFRLQNRPSAAIASELVEPHR